MQHGKFWLAVFASVLLSGPFPASASSESAGSGLAPGASERAPLADRKDTFTFSNWRGPDLPVFTYIPHNADPASAPIAIIMHGARRDPDRYRDEWIDEAERGGFIVIAPGFSRDDFPRALGYNLGATRDRESGDWRDEGLWSFSAIEPLFDDVVARLGSDQTHYTLYGHSAGSQFVHRFLFLKPLARAKRYLAANAGWYTFPDTATPFPFGLGHTPVGEDELRAALAKDVVILLGDQDIDTQQSSLNRSEGAMRQGIHRFERGQNFYAAARSVAAEKGWEFGWRLRIIEGVAHSNAEMAQGASDLVK